MEDYGPVDSETNPGLAMVVGETQVFQVEEWAEGIYAVTTDAGMVLFHARSGG